MPIIIQFVNMSDCLFCKIIHKEIPNYTVYEDEHCLAFLDIHPCTKGHTVVIPKKHSKTFLDTEDASVAGVMIGVKKTMEKLQSTLNPDGFNVGANQEKAGGQAVHHLHIHILPRWEGDGGGNMHSIVKKESDVSVEELAQLFT